MKKSKLLIYWENLVRQYHDRLTRAEARYLDTQEACFLFVLNHGSRNKDLELTNSKAFTEWAKRFIEYRRIVNKYQIIKGLEGFKHE